MAGVASPAVAEEAKTEFKRLRRSALYKAVMTNRIYGQQIQQLSCIDAPTEKSH